jgi:ABC-type transport system, involved in lipoprotein release, permease component
MRFKSAMRMLLRTPAKSLVTFILIAAVTFGFSSQVFEYAVASREMAKLADYFKITGTIEAGPVPTVQFGWPQALYTEIEPKIDLKDYYGWYIKDTPDPQYAAIPVEAVATIAAYPQVAASSTRYMGAGISETYYRSNGNIFLNDYSGRFVGEGIVEHTLLQTDRDGYSELTITFSDFNLLAGNPAWIGHSKVTVRMLLSSNEGNVWSLWYTIDTRFGLSSSAKHTRNFADSIQVGDRIIFLGKMFTVPEYRRFVNDTFPDYWCDLLRITTDEPDDYLQTEAYADYKLAIEMTKADNHTFDMIYVDDMMNIPRFADRLMTIRQGRALTAADSGTKNCVVSSSFLYDNKLEIGSTITMALGDKLFKQNADLGAVAAVPERYKAPVITEELTIVGSFSFTESVQRQAEGQYHTYNPDTIFVPKTLLPQSADTENMEIRPGEFSFVLNHPNNLESFVNDIEPYLKENGLTLVLGKNGDAWRKISSSFNSASDVSTLTIGVFLLAEMAVAIFVVYLYIGRRKREYAIMRVHGVTGKKAGNALFIPFMLLGFAAILAGCAGAFAYTTQAVGDVLKQYPTVQGYSYSAELPPLAAVGCALLATVFLAVPALFILRKLRMTQPLALLQDAQGARAKKAAITKTDAIAPITALPILPAGITQPLPKDASLIAALRHVFRYVARHIQRTFVKSLLSLLVPALLFAVIGQMVVMRQEYKLLYENMPVTGYFTEDAPAAQVLNLSKKPYLKDSYFIGEIPVRIGEKEALLILTNNFERYTNNADIRYIDGYNAETFDINAPACVVSEGLMPKNAKEATLITMDKYNMLEYQSRPSVEEPPNMVKLNAAVERESTAFTIYGTAAFKSVGADLPIILAKPGDWYWFFAGVDGLLEAAEFTLADNTQADLLREDGEKAALIAQSASPSLQFILDLTALENVKRINEIMVKLFPLILAALVIIGGFFQVLMLSQLSKDAARLRLLGTPPRRIAAILALERLLLLLLGFMLSMLGLILFSGEALRDTAGTIAKCALLFLAVNITAILALSFTISKRNPLKSTQAKE